MAIRMHREAKALFAKPVTVVKKKKRSTVKQPETRAQIYSQDDVFGRLKRRSTGANVGVRVVEIRESSLRVELLAPFGPLIAGDTLTATYRPARLTRSGKDLHPIHIMRRQGLDQGSIVDLLHVRIHADGTFDYKWAELVDARPEPGLSEIRPATLASIRSTVAMREGGIRPEIFLLRRGHEVPIHMITTGLRDMLKVLQPDEPYGNPGFLLRGADPKSGRRYAGLCVLTAKQRQSGASIEDALGHFLRREAPGLSKMVRDSGKTQPWEIVPLDILPTTEDFAVKASHLASTIPFNEDIKGQRTWFAECLVGLAKDPTRGWEVSYLNARRDYPVLVGPDFPDGDIEPEVEIHMPEPSAA